MVSRRDTDARVTFAAGSTTATRVDAVRVRGELADKFVTRIAAGLSHSVAVTRDELVFAWGANARGQLGVNDSSALALHAPQQLRGVEWRVHGGVRDVCAGGQHTVVVTRDGTAFAFGGASWGATALDHANDAASPTRVSLAHIGGAAQVVRVACGGDHTLFQLADGALLSSVFATHAAAIVIVIAHCRVGTNMGKRESAIASICCARRRWPTSRRATSLRWPVARTRTRRLSTATATCGRGASVSTARWDMPKRTRSTVRQHV